MMMKNNSKDKMTIKEKRENLLTLITFMMIEKNSSENMRKKKKVHA